MNPSQVRFKVGDLESQPGENNGSAMILSYAKLNGLHKHTTLHLFGEYYRKDVVISQSARFERDFCVLTLGLGGV